MALAAEAHAADAAAAAAATAATTTEEAEAEEAADTLLLFGCAVASDLQSNGWWMSVSLRPSKALLLVMVASVGGVVVVGVAGVAAWLIACGVGDGERRSRLPGREVGELY